VLESADADVVADAPKDATAAAVTEAPPEATQKRRRLGFAAWLAIGWIVLVSVTALITPWLPLKDPKGGLRPDYANAGKGWFTAGHPFGVDETGRDVFSRVLWGARYSLTIAIGSIVVGFFVGGLLGLIAGYRRGKTDSVLSASFNIILAFPPLLLALALVAAFSPATDEHPATTGNRMLVMIFAIGLVSIPILARITRANTLTWSEREFVTAARAQGATSPSVMFKEVLPNVLPAMLSIALLGIAIVLVTEGGLAIFGLSIPAPTPSWGNMIAAQIGTLDAAPHIWLAPALFIFLTVLAFNYLGDVVRRLFDVRESVL
jgi:peptide/nickel transport system permease protein